jgi:hypothetical protein
MGRAGAIVNSRLTARRPACYNDGMVVTGNKLREARAYWLAHLDHVAYTHDLVGLALIDAVVTIEERLRRLDDALREYTYVVGVRVDDTAVTLALAETIAQVYRVRADETFPEEAAYAGRVATAERVTAVVEQGYGTKVDLDLPGDLFDY